MEYPPEFPQESQSKVEKERIKAGRAFDSGKTRARTQSDREALFRVHLLAPFLIFAREAARLRLWPLAEMDSRCREFLRVLTIEGYSSRGKAAGVTDKIDNLNGRIRWEFQQELERTSQWHQYEDILLRLAELTSRATSKGKTERSALIDDFITKVKTEVRRITRKDIWTVAGYTDATEFERFQRGDERATASAVENFTRVLNMTPADFIRVLDRKKALGE